MIIFGDCGNVVERRWRTSGGVMRENGWRVVSVMVMV